MTIADNLTALANQKLGYQDSVEACIMSLTNKDIEVPVGAKLADISGLIDEIQQDPSIPVGTGQHLVTFYDYDGKVLKRQRVNTGESATSPAIPTHQYLTFAEWNNPFTNVQSDIDTGAIYNTTDGKTYLFITLTAVTGLAPTLFFWKSSTSLMTIDWGDGTTSTSTTSGNQNINHVYATAGDYIITVDNSAGGTFSFGNGAATATVFQGYTSILNKVYCGSFMSLGNFSFRLYQMLKYLSLSSVNLDSLSLESTINIQHINFGQNISGVGILNGSNKIKIVLKSTQSTLNLTNCFGAIYTHKIIFPESITSMIGNILSNAYVNIIIIKSVIPPAIASTTFSGINPICKIYVPDASVEAYKTATNWITYANYIYPLSQKPQSDE